MQRLITLDSHILDHSHMLINGMLASLLAAGSWLIIASHFGWPVSTTHSITGAIIGFGAVCLGLDYVHWSLVWDISLSWILTPLISGFIAYLIFISLQKMIFQHEDPIKQAKFYIPFYMFSTFLTTSLLLLFLCLPAAEQFSSTKKLIIGFLVSLFASLLVSLFKQFNASIHSHSSTDNQHTANLHSQDSSTLIEAKQKMPSYQEAASTQIEKAFRVLTLLTACTMAFAHGSNDIANAIGPLVAIVQALTQQSHTPIWISLLGTFGIVIGLATYGHKVIATIGNKITYLTPSRSFTAQIATASTILLSSSLGLPVSTTQVLVGAIMGVGLAKGIAALNSSMIYRIFLSWIVTLPAGAGISIAFFYLFQLINP